MWLRRPQLPSQPYMQNAGIQSLPELSNSFTSLSNDFMTIDVNASGLKLLNSLGVLILAA